jgi:GNAT superfamily N-acetyltransferase
MKPEYQLYTLEERPEFLADIERLSRASWPRFMLNGVSGWDLLYGEFAKYQLLLCDDADRLIAVGHTVPMVWNGLADDLPETIEGIIESANQARRAQTAPNTFSALAAMVDPTLRGNDLSTAILLEMKRLAARHGCSNLVAPVRPTLKSRYALTPMERYIQWTRTDGGLLDPWLRIHQRLGARGLAIAPKTLTVEATVEDWEAWTDMAFPESGLYIVPGALQPVSIDRERNVGIYHDPNYWMQHKVDMQ